MIVYCCRECGAQVEDTGDVLFCPDHPSAVIDSVLGAGEDTDKDEEE